MSKISSKVKVRKAVPGNVSAVSKKKFPFFETGILFIGLSLLFSFFPPITRGWGLNYTGFFDIWLMIFFYLLLLWLWTPQSNRYLVEKLSSIKKSTVIAFCGKHRHTIFLLLSIAAGFCFYLLKIKYILLGDTDIRAKQIENGELMKGEYMTMLCIRKVWQFLHEKFAYTGVQTVRLFGYVSGGVYVFISLCIADLIGKTFLKKVAAFCIATLSLTALLLFCGYTDTYMLALVFLIAYLYAAMLHLKGKLSIWIPAIFLLSGVSFHLMLVSLTPSLLYLVYCKYQSFFRKKKTLYGLAILAVIASPFIYRIIREHAFPMMLPMQSNDGSMTMFSLAHYVEFFNSQMLGGGIGFLIWIATLIYSIRHKIKYDARLIFFLTASLSFTGMMFVFIMYRGSGDWDIASFAAVVYNLSNACFLLSVYERKLYRNMKYGLVMLAGFSILHTSAWIYTNKTDALITWVESAFATDPAGYYKSSFSNESMLAAAFSANGLQEHALKWGKKAYQKHQSDPRVGFNYANELIKLNRNAEACAILEQSVKKFPLYPLPYISLIGLYFNSNDYGALYRVLLAMEQAYRQSPQSFTSRLSQEQINQYFSMLEDLKKQNPN
ncbi:MAG: hypothetical protein LBC98_09845 [Prevotellaceae bacterium]|jgi:hypothetical protein|nr:hypothetical protein [Prevotellaceae bacterium]